MANKRVFIQAVDLVQDDTTGAILIQLQGQIEADVINADMFALTGGNGGSPGTGGKSLKDVDESLALVSAPLGTRTDAPLADLTTAESATARSGISLWKRLCNFLVALTARIPVLGQALAAASVPVVLPATQITTLTPPANPTEFPLPAAQLATLTPPANPTEFPLPAAQLTTLTPPAAISGFGTAANQVLVLANTNLGKIAEVITKVTAGLTAEQLTANDVPCHGLLVMARQTTAGVASNTNPVYVGTATSQSIPVMPSNFEGVWVPCINANALYIKTPVTATDGAVAVPVVAR